MQVEGFGIKSMSTIFVEFGYRQRDELQFPEKKLRALWFSPPKDRPDLPRIFISELKVLCRQSLFRDMNCVCEELPLFCCQHAACWSAR